MPQPSIGQVHSNVPLTNISVAYIQNQADFIAGKVFPTVPVKKQSDIYYKYTKNDWFRDESRRRAPGTESAGGGYELTTDTFYCDCWAFHKDIPWSVRDNADSPLNLDRDATEFVTQRQLIRRERLFAEAYFTTSVWGKDYTGVSSAPGADQFYQWSDYTNSDPVADIATGRAYIKGITGFKPNTLVLAENVFETLKQHPDIIDRYKYTQAGVITADLIAKVFEVDRILVAGAIYATNAEGATEAYAPIFSKAALLCYSAPAPNIMMPSAGYCFGWKPASNPAANEYGMSMDKFEIRSKKVDRVEGEMYFDMKLVASDCGVYFTAAIA